MNVYFIIGPSGAGKSTYIKENFKDTKVIDLYNYQKGPWFSVADIQKSYDDCEKELVESLKDGKDVILEHTLLMRKRRPQYIEAVRNNCNCKLICIVIKPSLETLLQRRAKRFGTTEIESDREHAKEMLNMLELPLNEDGFDEIRIIEE